MLNCKMKVFTLKIILSAKMDLFRNSTVAIEESKLRQNWRTKGQNGGFLKGSGDW